MKITEDENNQTDEFSYSNKSQTPEQEEIIIWQLKQLQWNENWELF